MKPIGLEKYYSLEDDVKVNVEGGIRFYRGYNNDIITPPYLTCLRLDKVEDPLHAVVQMIVNTKKAVTVSGITVNLGVTHGTNLDTINLENMETTVDSMGEFDEPIYNQENYIYYYYDYFVVSVKSHDGASNVIRP